MATLQVLSPKGMIKDTNNTALPNEYFSHTQNARFEDGAVKKVLGQDQVFGTPTVAPYFAINWTTGANSYWFYAGSAKIYRYDGSNHTEFTRTSGTYSTNLTGVGNWVGSIFNGLPILNNGVDDPQCLANTGANKFTDLTNWPASTTCKVIRPYKSFLIALNLTESSSSLPNKVRWGNSAENLSLPSTWTAAANNDAGSVTLGDAGDFIIDGFPLKQSFIIYKENTTYLMNFIGGNLVFSFQKLFDDSGVLSRNCVAEYNGNHFVVTNGDIIIHNGVKKQSIATNIVKRTFFEEIDSTNYANTFVTHNKQKNEIWVSYPTVGSTYCNKALIWNYNTNSFSFRELPEILHISTGIVNPGTSSVVWSGQSQSWIAYSTTENWGQREFNPTETSILMSSTGDTKLYRADNGFDFAGNNFTMILERKGLTLDGNTNTVKQVRKITPKFSSTGTAEVFIGSSMSPDGTYTYKTQQSINPDTQNKVDARATGKYIAIKFQNTTATTFELNGYDIEYEVLGER
tara:strand:- start:2144 stop:3691 length:1548 start_codon:yes stop_codon:yes gene_type:complete